MEKTGGVTEKENDVGTGDAVEGDRACQQLDLEIWNTTEYSDHYFVSTPLMCVSFYRLTA